MTGDYFTKCTAGTKRNVKKRYQNRGLFFLVVLFLSFPAFGQNSPPSFTAGATQNLSACYDESAISINSRLAISDADMGQTETWSVAMNPVNGTLAGFNTTAISTGGVITPVGLTYTPAAGYTGTDSFTIQVSDGIATASTTVYVIVWAPPTLSSTLTPGAICDQSVFSYTPASATGGTTFAWSRPFNGGLSNPAATGSGSVSETLVNITYYDIPVTYNYTATAHGCSSHQNVVVTVHPTPRLSSPLYDTTCNGGTFTYVPATSTAGTTFSWSRASVAGITPATSSGTGNISETLSSSNTTLTDVVYSFMLSANGCTSTRNVTVAILPQAPITAITTMSPSSVCEGTLYQNFGAAAPPPAGATYVWSAVNADITAVGGTGQFCLVSFPAAGEASVSLSILMAGAHCANNGTYAVNVGTGVSLPGAGILNFNFQLVYLDNTQDSYQWGYDNAVTLDSAIIPGAVFQSYPYGSATPDFADNYYWVMTMKNGCGQKTYYNAPTSVPGVNAATEPALNLYPNPADNTLNVAISTSAGNASEVAIVNVLGETIRTATCTGQHMQFDISELPSGCYFVTCSQNGLKIATGRFIKN